MGVVPLTPRKSTRPRDTTEFLIGAFVGSESFPLTSDFWQKLLELPLTLRWPTERVLEACQTFGALIPNRPMIPVVELVGLMPDIELEKMCREVGWVPFDEHF